MAREHSRRSPFLARHPCGERRDRWRGLLGQLAPLLLGVALLVVATLVLSFLGFGTGSPVRGDREPVASVDRAAPDFRLTDQSGAAIALRDLRGKVVALTFLYSHCPDICPITLGEFGLVHDQLGALAADAVFLVVTVDPERDDPARLRQYLAAQGLDQKVRFLTGDRSAVERVWRDYGVTVARGPATGEAQEGQYEVIHTDRIYLIDRAGCQRGLLRSTAPPQDLLAGLTGLLAVRNTGAAVPCG